MREADAGWDVDKIVLMEVENPAAIRARKLDAKLLQRANDYDGALQDAQLRALLFQHQQTERMSAAWLQPWRANAKATPTFEADVICGFTADCVAIDELVGDTIA